MIMLKHFSKEHTQIILDLKPYPPLLFQYLKQIMNARSGIKPSKGASLPSVEQTTTNLHLLDNTNSGVLVIEDLSDLVKNAGLEFSNETEEQYVEVFLLLANFSSSIGVKYVHNLFLYMCFFLPAAMQI